MNRRTLVALLGAVLAVAALAAIQHSLARDQVVVLARPLSLGPDTDVVAYSLADDELRADGSLQVSLYLDGRVPERPPRLGLTPVGFDKGYERPPDLSRSTDSTDGLARLDVALRVPRWQRDNPGTYTLRIFGERPTFGLVDLKPRSRR